MALLALELGSIMAATAVTALALIGPADNQRVPAQPAAHIAVTQSTPQIAVTPVLPGQMVRRHADGLFYVEAQANGHSIRFVVDTGATVVVLNRTDAEKLGLHYERLQSRGSMRTVSGTSDMRWAKIDKLDMAGKRIEQINAAIVDAPLPVSLMGQNALEQLGTVTLRGDTLTIH